LHLMFWGMSNGRNLDGPAEFTLDLITPLLRCETSCNDLSFWLSDNMRISFSQFWGWL
jgi:hypothetical protein